MATASDARDGHDVWLVLVVCGEIARWRWPARRHWATLVRADGLQLGGWRGGDVGLET